MIYNDKLKFNNYIEKCTSKKIFNCENKAKNIVDKKIKYWMNKEELKKVCNAYIQGLLYYGITLWTKESFKLIDNIEKLRTKIIRIVYGFEETKNLNMKETLDLFNWKTLDEHRIVAENIIIHKIINTKKQLKYIKV